MHNDATRTASLFATHGVEGGRLVCLLRLARLVVLRIVILTHTAQLSITSRDTLLVTAFSWNDDDANTA